MPHVLCVISEIPWPTFFYRVLVACPKRHMQASQGFLHGPHRFMAAQDALSATTGPCMQADVQWLQQKLLCCSLNRIRSFACVPCTGAPVPGGASLAGRGPGRGHAAQPAEHQPRRAIPGHAAAAVALRQAGVGAGKYLIRVVHRESQCMACCRAQQGPNNRPQVLRRAACCAAHAMAATAWHADTQGFLGFGRDSRGLLRKQTLEQL